MADEPTDHALYLEERKSLVDAARESARTFDQAVLAFGSAIFGASIAFLKDVAPKPQLYTLKWLAGSWCLFSIGLLGVLLSFLSSHRACIFEIEEQGIALGQQNYNRKQNHWSTITNWCNVSCVVLLFLGLLLWSVFAIENLGKGDSPVNNAQQQPSKIERGYVPPPPPPRSPAPPLPSSPTPPAKK